MSILKRIGPAAALKVGLVLHAFVGLITRVLCGLIALTGTPFASHAHMPFAGTIEFRRG